MSKVVFYTPAECKKIKACSNLKGKERREKLDSLAAELGRDYNNVLSKFYSLTMGKKSKVAVSKVNRPYVPKAVVSTNRIIIPFKELHIDMAKKEITFGY